METAKGASSSASEGAVDPASLRVGELLGRGGFANCWKASFMGKQCAIKVMSPRPSPVAKAPAGKPAAAEALAGQCHRPPAGRDLYERMFLREAQITMQLQHRHIVRCYGVTNLPAGFTPKQAEPALAMVLELCDTHNLKDLILRGMMAGRRTYKIQQAFEWLRQIASALAHLHRQKPAIIHRDVKPENILLARGADAAASGGSQRLICKLSDLGLHAEMSGDRPAMLRRRSTRRLMIAGGSGSSVGSSAGSVSVGGIGGSRSFTVAKSSAPAAAGVDAAAQMPWRDAAPAGTCSARRLLLAGIDGGGGGAGGGSGVAPHRLASRASSARCASSAVPPVAVTAVASPPRTGGGGRYAAAGAAAAPKAASVGVTAFTAAGAVAADGDCEQDDDDDDGGSPFLTVSAAPSLVFPSSRADTGGGFKKDLNSWVRQSLLLSCDTSACNRSATGAADLLSSDRQSNFLSAVTGGGMPTEGGGCAKRESGSGRRRLLASSAAVIDTNDGAVARTYLVSGSGAAYPSAGAACCSGEPRLRYLTAEAASMAVTSPPLPLTPPAPPTTSTPAGAGVSLSGVSLRVATPPWRSSAAQLPASAAIAGTAAASNISPAELRTAAVESYGRGYAAAAAAAATAALQGPAPTTATAAAAPETLTGTTAAAAPATDRISDSSVAASSAVEAGPIGAVLSAAAAATAAGCGCFGCTDGRIGGEACERAIEGLHGAAERDTGGVGVGTGEGTNGIGHKAGARDLTRAAGTCSSRSSSSQAGSEHGVDAEEESTGLSKLLTRHPELVEPVSPENPEIGLRNVGSLLAQLGIPELKPLRRQEMEWVYGLTGKAGSFMYMAPEVFRNLPYNEKSDVFSFGVLAYEFLASELLTVSIFNTGRAAKMGITEPQGYAALVAGGYRPPRIMALSDAAWALIESCWHPDPVMRPPMSEVELKLDRLVATAGAAAATSSAAAALADRIANSSVSFLRVFGGGGAATEAGGASSPLVVAAAAAAAGGPAAGGGGAAKLFGSPSARSSGETGGINVNGGGNGVKKAVRVEIGGGGALPPATGCTQCVVS